MTTMPVRPRRARLTAPIRRTAASSPLLRRFQDTSDRAADAADSSDESLARYDRLLQQGLDLLADELPPLDKTF